MFFYIMRNFFDKQLAILHESLIEMGNKCEDAIKMAVNSLFDENPDIEKIIHAAEAAQIIDDINKMPDGFDTVLGEKGHGLSEGQVQRLAIARALYYDAPVLLLDEATSSLDIATEEKLLTSIKQMTDKTCVIISHRHEVMQACDKTYILQDGSLNELNNIPPRTIIDPIQE